MIFFLGLAVGFISAFFGIGGGVLLVPLLPYFFPLSPYEAVILSLTIILFSVSFNTFLYNIDKKISWNVVLKLGSWICLGGYIASLFSSSVDESYLRVVLFLVLSFMCFRFIKAFLKLQREGYSLDDMVSERHLPVILSPLGAVAGAFSGFAGVGTGLILNFVLLHWKLVTKPKQAPTVNALMIFVCIGAILANFTSSDISLIFIVQKMGLFSVLAVIVGIMLGSFVGREIHDRDFHKLRFISLALITFTLAVLVLYEIVFS